MQNQGVLKNLPNILLQKKCIIDINQRKSKGRHAQPAILSSRVDKTSTFFKEKQAISSKESTKEKPVFPLSFACLFVTLRFASANLLRLGKKKKLFLLFCSRLFVTLQEFSAFLCIKAVWGIEKKLGYELETVLNSTFCYELHSMNTR